MRLKLEIETRQPAAMKCFPFISLFAFQLSIRLERFWLWNISIWNLVHSFSFQFIKSWRWYFLVLWTFNLNFVDGNKSDLNKFFSNQSKDVATRIAISFSNCNHGHLILHWIQTSPWICFAYYAATGADDDNEQWKIKKRFWELCRLIIVI